MAFLGDFGHFVLVTFLTSLVGGAGHKVLCIADGVVWISCTHLFGLVDDSGLDVLGCLEEPHAKLLMTPNHALQATAAAPSVL